MLWMLKILIDDERDTSKTRDMIRIFTLLNKCKDSISEEDIEVLDTTATLFEEKKTTNNDSQCA